jgi:protein-export membrane protein, SecD/SecF family/protein-export membrane protein SecF/protein-export membrane protein SecD
MQNKGAIKTLAIIFAIIFLYQLSFTLVTKRTESKARKFAKSEEALQMANTLAKGEELNVPYLLDSIQAARENYYLDSISNVVVYNILIDKYTYREAKEKEINLGLDLKGGMNVTLEVSVKDIVNALSGNSQDPVFTQAMKMATEKLANSEGDFVTLFGESFKEADPNAKLASIFLYEFKDKGITVNSSNDEVLNVLREESEGAIDRSYQILRTRIDRFGVAQPNIQKIGNSGRILIELPGIKDAKRVRKLLQGTAQLEFWETYNFSEIAHYFNDANARLAEINRTKADATTSPEVGDSSIADVEESVVATENNDSIQEEVAETETTETLVDATKEADLLEQLGMEDSTAAMNKEMEAYREANPLYVYLQPSFYQNASGQFVPGETARVGMAQVKDTVVINQMLKQVKSIFPRNLKFAWTVKPERAEDEKEYLELVALKASRDNKSALGGEVIVDARQDYGQNNQVEVTIQMNSEGAKAWKRLTGENIGKQVAIVLDNYVYSFPVVNDEIPSGRSSISGGNMSIEEAQDLANILKAGKLPAPARILEEQVVGPSLGREAVQKGMWSMIFAFILILVYMLFFYKKSGFVADTALMVNVFFLFGTLAALGSVLTLPGIAGIVLTLGMAVDSNVIIFERIKEEIRNGKGLRLAIEDGYKNAYSAIIDGNVTTLITGIILIILGTGPVHSFAVTLCIGIITSLFTSIFITRIIFFRMLDKNKEISFSTKATRNFLQNTNFNFIGFRKNAYIIAGIFIVICAGSLAFRGMNLGIDFKGGRNYVIRFDKDVPVNKVRQALAAVPEFDGQTPEVKTYGTNRQVKVTTKYMIDAEGPAVDSTIQSLLYNGLKDFYNNPLSYDEFTSDSEKGDVSFGILSSQKVGATIASDVTKKAIIAVIVSLAMMFVYIAIRFRKWQYGLSALLALTHDTILVLGMYSLFYNILPFSMEVDQSFIAAVLTVIGYSINATVVIFDRVRENVKSHPKRSWKENMTTAVNSTLTRSFNTTGSTLIVLLAIFIFGGETIRGFIFALLVGIIAGTFSSVFLSTPIAYNLLGGSKADKMLEESNVQKK